MKSPSIVLDSASFALHDDDDKFIGNYPLNQLVERLQGLTKVGPVTVRCRSKSAHMPSSAPLSEYSSPTEKPNRKPRSMMTTTRVYEVTATVQNRTELNGVIYKAGTRVSTQVVDNNIWNALTIGFKWLRKTYDVHVRVTDVVQITEAVIESPPPPMSEYVGKYPMG